MTSRKSDSRLKLPLSLQAYNSSAFNIIFKKEISALDADALPLQQGLSGSSYAKADHLYVTILKIDNDKNNILVKAGLFYTGIIAGCNCADDPTPENEINEYCEVLFSINKKSADTTVSLIT